MNKLLILLVTTAFAASSCSYLTSSGRRQAAYARYVRHSSYAHAKMQRKLWPHLKLPLPSLSEPTIATSTGPQSVTSGQETTP